jgi:hypothetical protein
MKHAVLDRRRRAILVVVNILFLRALIHEISLINSIGISESQVTDSFLGSWCNRAFT